MQKNIPTQLTIFLTDAQSSMGLALSSCDMMRFLLIIVGRFILIA